MKPPKKPYYCETKSGAVVMSEVRAHDGQVLVTTYVEGELVKLMPVDTDDELATWFWTYVSEFGGEK